MTSCGFLPLIQHEALINLLEEHKCSDSQKSSLELIKAQSNEDCSLFDFMTSYNVTGFLKAKVIIHMGNFTFLLHSIKEQGKSDLNYRGIKNGFYYTQCNDSGRNICQKVSSIKQKLLSGFSRFQSKI